MNVRIKTLKSMAIGLAAPEIARRGLQLTNSRAGALLVHQVLRDLSNRDGKRALRYLAEIELSPRLADATRSSIVALRLAGIGSRDLAAKHFEVTRKGKDLRNIVEACQRRLLRPGKTRSGATCATCAS